MAKRFAPVFAAILVAASVQGAVVHVPADQPTIQDGIDAASQGDTVLVAPGTYSGEGNVNLDFAGIDRVLLSEAGPDLTVIDCEGSGRGFYFHSNETAATAVVGFTVQGGSAENGGAVYCSDSNPRFKNCTITANTASDGGGICCISSSPTFDGCMIAGNTASDGGGLYCSDSHPILVNCTISGNSADHGGGLFCTDYSDPTLVKCTISDNSATDGGGVLCIFAASPKLTNCTISGNTASGGGGLSCFPLSDARLTSCKITNNNASRGGGLSCSSSSPSLTNCTISGNTAYDGGGIHYTEASPILIGCIVWGNTPDAIYGRLYEADVTYSDIEGGWEGAGNIDADPIFRSLGRHDYLLGPLSPCIDAGNPVIEDRISDWHQRWPDWYPNGPRSDMGTYGGPGNRDWMP